MSLVLVVTVVVFIVSEKVTEMLSVIETPLWLSVAEIEETVGAVVSVVVVVSVVPVAEYSSFSSLQEMMVRLKQEIRKTNKNFFIFSSIPKVKYFSFVLGEPYLYHNLEDFTRMWEVCGVVSDCEELVGVTHRI